MSTVLVTGATGFIGRHLLKELPKRGYKIRVLLRRPTMLPPEASGAVVGDLAAPRVGVMTGALVKGFVRTDGEAPLTSARRALAGQAVRTPAFALKPVAPAPRPELDDDDAEPDSDERPSEPPVKATREAPPPPVAKALAKGAKAKKKKKD